MTNWWETLAAGLRRRPPAQDPAAQQDLEDDRGQRLAEELSAEWAGADLPVQATVGEPADDGGPHRERGRVPLTYDLAAAWSWRFLVITAAGLVILSFLNYFSVLVFPLVVALFTAALAAPLVNWLERMRIPRGLASLLVVLGGIAAIAWLLTFVGQQVASSMNELSTQVVDGLGEIRNWLQTGPLHASDSQVNTWIANTQDYITTHGKDLFSLSRVSELGVAVSHLVAALFIVFFASYFFLADGASIWAWLVRIFPRSARERADSSGRVAWRSLTLFVRATVLVALTDALGIMLIAAILKVPLVSAIGVLVFLGAFVPMIGAFLSGTVAVLVALVAHGPLAAALMLGGVVLVQQIEAHVLQPFLLGRFVSVHPLGVILAIGAGVLVAGIGGALVAVPLAAALNAVVQHLAAGSGDGEPVAADPAAVSEEPE